MIVGEDLLFWGEWIVVPVPLQDKTLCKLHGGLPTMSTVIHLLAPYLLADHCSQCCRDIRPQSEPVLISNLSNYPWYKAATDLPELKGTTYLVVVK